MFAFIKKMFCSDAHGNDNGLKDRRDLDARQRAAHEQDKQVRESLTEKQIDKGLKDTMEASDPVAKY